MILKNPMLIINKANFKGNFFIKVSYVVNYWAYVKIINQYTLINIKLADKNHVSIFLQW